MGRENRKWQNSGKKREVNEKNISRVKTKLHDMRVNRYHRMHSKNELT